LRRSIVSHTQQNCSAACKTILANGFNHAVFENLNKGFSKTRVTTKSDFNYNRLITEMRLSSIKDVFEHVARNGRHDQIGSMIATSFVHAEYTSQECSHCHYIDEDNRKTQEKFKCLSCGHEENADINAARNIEQRVSEAVQRNLLEADQKLGGVFRPKALHRRKVKEHLLAFRDARLVREQM
jgi:transposase